LKPYQIIAHHDAVGHHTIEIAAQSLEQAVAALVTVIAGVILKEDSPVYRTVRGSGEINHRFYPNGSHDYMWAPITEVSVMWDKIADTWTQTVKGR
jgi:hypothetical protein